MNRYKMFLTIKENSERVKRKNFRDFGSKPLHQYFIDKRNCFDIFIDTDSIEIYEFYNNNQSYPNVEVYMRKKEHIKMEIDGETGPAPYMIERFLKEFIIDNKEPIITSHITSPFIEDSTILKAISYLDNYQTVCGVRIIKEFCVDGIKSNGSPLNFSLDKVTRTQDLNPIGIVSGAFYIITKEQFFNDGLKRISNNNYYFPISEVEAIEIDTEFDLTMAKLYAERIL